MLAEEQNTSQEYWRQLLDKTRAMIDGRAIEEEFLGELRQTKQTGHNGCEFRLNLEKDGYLFFRGLIDSLDIQAARNEIFEQLKNVDELEDPFGDGIFSHRSRRDELFKDRGEFWETVSNLSLIHISEPTRPY